jgi:sec-independent protein translocase protein TatA
MPNIRPTELIIILVIIVLLFGAKKLPELAKSVGQSLKIFKNETKDETVSPQTAPPQMDAESHADASTATAAVPAPAENTFAPALPKTEGKNN